MCLILEIRRQTERIKQCFLIKANANINEIKSFEFNFILSFRRKITNNSRYLLKRGCESTENKEGTTCKDTETFYSRLGDVRVKIANLFVYVSKKIFSCDYFQIML